jgi:hypothetical protein
MTRTRSPLANPALLIASVALAGMAYCHLEDVGMKFEEHVYYMAVLFLGNIALSLLLIPALGLAYGKRSQRALRVTWAVAGGLAATTIGGFVWSRTIGFPQMADHIGEWDRLGLTSVAFETIVVALSARALIGLRMRPAVATTVVLAAMVAVALATSSALAHGMHPGMTMLGDPSPYPHLEQATQHQRKLARRLLRRTEANAPRFRRIADAAALDYRFSRKEDETIGFPGLRHMRLHGDNHFTGRVLDPTAPQALVYWCTAPEKCTLAAFMYRAPRNSRPPTYGPLLAWHKHNPRAAWMTHLWLTGDLRSALARCAPWPSLEMALGIHELPWHEDVDSDMACPTMGSGGEM